MFDAPKLNVDPIPSAYVVEQRTQRCVGCGRTHQFADVYRKHAQGSGFRLFPVKPLEVQWNVPVERITRQMEHVPFCHDCAGTINLSHLPKPPSHVEASRPVGGYRGEAEAKPTIRAKTPPRVATVDDI